MSIYNENAPAFNKNSLAIEEANDNRVDWRDLNKLIGIIENFRSFNSQPADRGNTPRAAFRITMKDNKPVFATSSQCKCPENAIAGLVKPQVYTTNNAGNHTAPYTYIKTPVGNATQPGGVIFMPPKIRRKKRSFVDLITWDNTLPNTSTNGRPPVTIHPEQQFLHWMRQQVAKDPGFARRIKKINMRLAHMPCKTCGHNIANRLTKLVGPKPQINIQVATKPGNAGASQVLSQLNRHPSITAKPVPVATTNTAVKSKVLQAIAGRQLKQGNQPPLANNGMRNTPNQIPPVLATPPIIKAKILQAITERKTKQQATTAPQPARHVTANNIPRPVLATPVIKSNIKDAIAERKMKQALASINAPAKPLKPLSVQVAQARINQLKKG